MHQKHLLLNPLPYMLITHTLPVNNLKTPLLKFIMVIPYGHSHLSMDIYTTLIEEGLGIYIRFLIYMLLRLVITLQDAHHL